MVVVGRYGCRCSCPLEVVGRYSCSLVVVGRCSSRCSCPLVVVVVVGRCSWPLKEEGLMWKGRRTYLLGSSTSHQVVRQNTTQTLSVR